MTDLTCPNCGGRLNVPSQSSTFVCPYCSTTIHVKTGKVLKENYIMRLQFGIKEAREKMLSWAMKQLGAPKGLESAEVKESKLIFWPFWVVEVEAKATYEGVQKKPDFQGRTTTESVKWKNETERGTIDLESDIFIPASSDTPKPLRNYVIPTKRKEYFNQDKILDVRGTTKAIQVSQERALDIARKSMVETIRNEALKEVDQIQKFDQKLDIPAVFLVNIPIWHIKYSYGLRTYEALVDAASGRVVHLKFPRKMAFRAMTMFSGLVHLGVGGGIGLLLTYLGLTLFGGIFPTVFGVVFGLGMLAFSLIFFRTALSLRAGIEEAK